MQLINFKNLQFRVKIDYKIIIENQIKNRDFYQFSSFNIID